MQKQFLIADKVLMTVVNNKGDNIRKRTEILYRLPRELAKNGVRNIHIASDAIINAIASLELQTTQSNFMGALLTNFKKERTHYIATTLIQNEKIVHFNGKFQKYNQANGSYSPIDDEEVKKEIKNNSQISMNSSEIKEVKEHLRIESTINENKLNSHSKHKYINCQNAMLEIEKMKIIVHPHSPNYFSTACLGVAYNVDSECPLWINFLSETFHNYGKEKEKAIQLLQEIMGYLLIPGNDYQKFFSFYGVARSGKSLIGNIISAMLGKENVSSLPFEKLGIETRTAELASKLLNLSSELSRGVKIDSAPIKSLVGQDKVFARKLYSEPFYFINQAKILTISNSLPFFNDNSSAIYERLIVLNFDRQVPADKRDFTLKNKLEKELEGIFLWSLQGLISLQKRGEFEELKKGIKTKEAIQSMSDSVLYWIEETELYDVQFDHDDGISLKTSLKKFYASYVSFCKENNIDIEKRSEFKLRVSQFHQMVIFKDTNKNQDYVEITL